MDINNYLTPWIYYIIIKFKKMMAKLDPNWFKGPVSDLPLMP